MPEFKEGKQGFIIVGELVVVLNCEFHVFVGVRFCIKGRRVVFATGHLQVPCAVGRLNGNVDEGIALLGMFCALNGIAQFGMFCARESKSSLDSGCEISLRKSGAALQLNGIPDTFRESTQECCLEQDDKGTNSVFVVAGALHQDCGSSSQSQRHDQSSTASIV